MKKRNLLSTLSVSLVSALCMSSAHASLQSLIDADVFNELEQQAAVATLETYRRLISNAGCSDNLIRDPGDTAGDGNPSSQCTGQVFTLFTNVREIIHTANELTGDGPTAFSLRSNIEGLGFALRWTAAEEYVAQGNISSEFVGGQVSGVATRLTALRAGASGFNVIGLASHYDGNRQNDAHSSNYIRGTGASSDGGSYGRLGGFITYDFGSGERAPTDLEDAFDFESSQITMGLDYRITDEWILGAVVGISDQEVDFDASQSIVEGNMVADGLSVMPFAMYQRGQWFISGSAGFQQMSFDTSRAIRYPSGNLNLPATDTVTVSSTDASMFSLFFEAGHSFQWQKFSSEPFLNIKYSDIAIDEFVEDDVNDDAFDLVIAKQDFSSQELTLGVKFQYTFTPSYGVFIPFLTLEHVKQSDDAPRSIQAYYAQDVVSENAFDIPTESLDSAYNVYSLGFSSVIRGARQTVVGGGVGGDVQAFFSYKQLEQLEGFDIQFYSLGVRYTF